MKIYNLKSNRLSLIKFNKIITEFCYVPLNYNSTSITIEDIREAAIKVLDKLSCKDLIKLALYFKERYKHWYPKLSNKKLYNKSAAKKFCFEVISKLSSYQCDLSDEFYRSNRVGRSVGDNVIVKEIPGKCRFFEVYFCKSS